MLAKVFVSCASELVTAMIYTVQKKKCITHFYFSKCKFCDLPGKIKWPNLIIDFLKVSFEF
jgi:hypothetical protein